MCTSGQITTTGSASPSFPRAIDPGTATTFRFSLFLRLSLNFDYKAGGQSFFQAYLTCPLTLHACLHICLVNPIRSGFLLKYSHICNAHYIVALDFRILETLALESLSLY
jgi:hypothetical protein